MIVKYNVNPKNVLEWGHCCEWKQVPVIEMNFWRGCGICSGGHDVNFGGLSYAVKYWR